MHAEDAGMAKVPCAQHEREERRGQLDAQQVRLRIAAVVLQSGGAAARDELDRGRRSLELDPALPPPPQAPAAEGPVWSGMSTRAPNLYSPSNILSASPTLLLIQPCPYALLKTTIASPSG